MDIFVIDNKIGIDMKNYFTLLMVLLVISSVCSYADEKDGGNTSKSIKIISNKGKGKMTKADSLLFLSIEMCHSGETFTRSYWESGVADISNIGYNIKFGYEFNSHWKIYTNAKMKYVLYNKQSTQDFYTQGELGLGTVYTFLSKGGRLYYEPDISISSDLFKYSPRCFNAKTSFKIGVNADRFKPFISLYIEYMKPYTEMMRQSVFAGISVGIDLL